MTPTETLRAAAAQVREIAQVATPGPWWRSDNNKWIWGKAASAVAADPQITAADGTHIVMWHPGIALAVADWLDDAAGSLEANDNARALGYVPKGYVAALAVARVLLPIDDET